MNTGDIMELLRTRHAGDVYYEEPVIEMGKLRMDAWAMIKSWAHPRVIGYEVKLTRADFMHDHKMQRYLPYCNEMYLICPRGIVDPKEVNESFGLIYVASTGTKLITRKKAPWRDIQIPDQFYRSLLFSKASNDLMNMTATEREIMNRISQLRTLEAYSDGRKELKELGGIISGKISREYKAMLFDKVRVDEGMKELVERQEVWDKTARKLRSIFGYRFQNLLRDGEGEYVAELMRIKMEQLEHPEREVMRLIDVLSSSLAQFRKDISKGDTDEKV